MTLTEARIVLEKNIGNFEGEVAEAISLAITILPKKPEKPSAKKRLTKIINEIDHDPFNGARDTKSVVWRQCIIYKMFLENFTQMEISKATGLNHATIYHNIHAVEDGLTYKDYTIQKIWNELLNKLC